MITVKNGRTIHLPPVAELRKRADTLDRAREAVEAIARAHVAVFKLSALIRDPHLRVYLGELESRLRSEEYLLTTRLEQENENA